MQGMTSDKLVDFAERTLCKDSLATYDPYDIWLLPCGVFLKRKFYSKHFFWKVIIYGYTAIGLATTSLLQRAGVLEKREYPIVRAQAGLALLNLFELTGKAKFLRFAEKHFDWLVRQVNLEEDQIAWGIGFDWVVSQDLTYAGSTPLITHTYYVIEFANKLKKHSNNPTIDLVLTKVTAFIDFGLVPMIENKRHLAYAYADRHDRVALNVQTYIISAIQSTKPYSSLSQDIRHDRVVRLLQFVRDCQKANGSWLYEPLNKKSFIDGFHTCFALKCLKAINDKRLSAEIEPIITSGYNYLLTAFTNDDMLSRRFSKANKINPVAFDLYDQAELLQVLILFEDFPRAKKLLISVNSLFGRKSNYYSKVYQFGIKSDFGTLRWAVVPFVYALTMYYKSQSPCVVLPAQ